MVFGMSLQSYTLIHVVISVIGIASGVVMLYGLLKNKRLDAWTAVFLISTVLTSVTGFGFPFDHLLPSHKVAILSLVALAIAAVARYPLHFAGAWRRTYVICACVALYFNCFVLVFQLFEKVPALKALAPTQKEPPFAVAQLLLLTLFVVLTVFAAKRFRSELSVAVRAASRAA
jgi:hypothetical protein